MVQGNAVIFTHVWCKVMLSETHMYGARQCCHIHTCMVQGNAVKFTHVWCKVMLSKTHMYGARPCCQIHTAAAERLFNTDVSYKSWSMTHLQKCTQQPRRQCQSHSWRPQRTAQGGGTSAQTPACVWGRVGVGGN